MVGDTGCVARTSRSHGSSAGCASRSRNSATVRIVWSAAGIATGVVDQNVDRAERRFDRLDRGASLLGRREVGGYRQGGCATTLEVARRGV
jgi:hypothetical protein